MLRLRLIHCAILIIFAVLSPRLVEACGGFFCSTQPMNQLSERILFVDRGDSVTTHVQIQYSGSAADFAWILPVPSVPKLGISHNEVFQQLQFATQPFFSLEWDKNGECGSVFPPFFRSFAEDAATTGAEVDIVAEQRVGPYDTVVLSSTDADAIVTWLVDNGYQLGDLGRDLLQPYVDGGFFFIALRLAPDRELGDLQPISLSYAADTPGIPIQLTAVATAPDLGVTAWILAEARAVPTNFLHVQINEALIDWFNGGFNYDDVVRAAVDAASEGQAFVTDYAGPSKIMSGRFPTDSYDTSALARLDDAARFLDTALRQGLPRDAQMQALLRRHMPMPQAARIDGVLEVVFGGDREAYEQAAAEGFLASLAERAFYNDLSAFRPWLTDWSFDAVALAQDLERVVVEPLRATQRLFSTHPYLTRLYTTLSAEEMTVDPMFDVNPDLPDVSNQRTALARWECEGFDPENIDFTELVLVVTLRDGRQIRSRPFADGPWPLAREADIPAASVVERLNTSGPPVLVQRLTAIADDTVPTTVPTQFGLHLTYPNPFNAATIIPFTVPAEAGASMVTVTIHDLLGQRVRTLLRSVRSPGRQQVVWDGRGEDGSNLASGVYLIRLEAGTSRFSQKILYVQ